MTFDYFGGYFVKPSVGDSCSVTGLPLITFHYFWGITLGSLPSGTSAGLPCGFCGASARLLRSFCEASAELLRGFCGASFSVSSVYLSCLVFLLILFRLSAGPVSSFCSSFRRGQLLSSRPLLMTFHYFGRVLWEAFRRGPLLNLVTRPRLITFLYFAGLLCEAFRRGQLLSNRVTFNDFPLLRRVTLESLPSGTAA